MNCYSKIQKHKYQFSQILHKTSKRLQQLKLGSNKLLRERIKLKNSKKRWRLRQTRFSMVHFLKLRRKLQLLGDQNSTDHLIQQNRKKQFGHSSLHMITHWRLFWVSIGARNLISFYGWLAHQFSNRKLCIVGEPIKS